MGFLHATHVIKLQDCQLIGAAVDTRMGFQVVPHKLQVRVHASLSLGRVTANCLGVLTSFPIARRHADLTHDLQTIGFALIASKAVKRLGYLAVSTSLHVC